MSVNGLWRTWIFFFFLIYNKKKTTQFIGIQSGSYTWKLFGSKAENFGLLKSLDVAFTLLNIIRNRGKNSNKMFLETKHILTFTFDSANKDNNGWLIQSLSMNFSNKFVFFSLPVKVFIYFLIFQFLFHLCYPWDVLSLSQMLNLL